MGQQIAFFLLIEEPHARTWILTECAFVVTVRSWKNISEHAENQRVLLLLPRWNGTVIIVIDQDSEENRKGIVSGIPFDGTTDVDITDHTGKPRFGCSVANVSTHER